MSEQKVQFWQPTNHLALGEVYEWSFNFSNNGLIITLIDSRGHAVDIIYNQRSSEILDYVWSFRYAGETRGDYDIAIDAAFSKPSNRDTSSQHFYKVGNSEYLKWVNTLWLPVNEVKNVEVHLYPYEDGLFEVVSTYEPKIKNYLVNH